MTNYILKDESASYYECGFSCDSQIFIRLGNEAFYITDGRYTIEAKEALKDAEVIEADTNLLKSANSLLKDTKIKEILYDPKEWSVYEFEKLKDNLNIKFTPKENFLQIKRIIKTDKEIELLKKAVKLGADRFEQYAKRLTTLLDKDERYLYFEAYDILSTHGENQISFEPIIALDQNSAKPHAHPTSHRLKEDSFILFDAGVKYQRYCSDRTRCTSFNPNLNFEKKQYFKNKKKQKIYDIVLKAQEEAIKAIRPGIKAKEIDKIARDVIENAGYGKYFVHSTGHGVGLDIHEEPYISKTSETLIDENMIFTIEPGIYLEGEFGVRIEDMVRVTKDGVEVL
ncbi:MAG: X-Pro aminopeptidase [Sulfurospirillum sp.]|nr:MAG: X-Pro aminopeptidase [Sulfurospirillum sp.]